MSLWLFTLGILAFFHEQRPSYSITHNAQVDAYVKKLIAEFKIDPRNRVYDNAIVPPRLGDGVQNFLLPKKGRKKHEGNSRIIPFVPLPSVKSEIDGKGKERRRGTARLNCGAISDNIVQLDNVWNSCDIDTTVVEGLSANAILMLENVEDMCNETVTGLLLKKTKNMLDMLEEINQQCNDRSFNAYDLPVKQSVGDNHVVASDAHTDPLSEHDHTSLVERNLYSFNLLIDPVEGDGDCAFRSILKQLRNMLEWNDANTKLNEHLEDLGLTGANLDDDVFNLRQLFVDNVQSNEYYQMLLGISKEELNTETERFREQGTFSGEVGDLVANSSICKESKFPIRAKNTLQIAGKLQQLEQKRNVLMFRLANKSKVNVLC
ncbi:hypothetical protein AWC38_SpisGene2234 [Stylophora pistillata]|uniref:OTU domain-containing protein n=1 Tax=Stylophora pistillata TaxID=50429 RepID=A0A2B4SX00_STYPI|nr:hypothetical protein AWC38_SpisGene2234 [Stylophora pistillata]